MCKQRIGAGGLAALLPVAILVALGSIAYAQQTSIVGAYCTQAFVNNGTRAGFRITRVDANGVVSGYIGGRGINAWIAHFGRGANATYNNGALTIYVSGNNATYTLRREGRRFVGAYRSNTGWRDRVVFDPNDKSCRRQRGDPA